MEYDTYNDYYYPDYLMHYGVKGMKWGHRKNVISVKAGYQRALAKANDININYYSKRNSRFAKQMTSMNKAAKKSSLAAAERYQAEANAKRDQKMAAKQAKKSERGKAKADKVLAKNTKVKDAVSFKAAGHKAYAKMFEINENYYSKRSGERNEAMANMNKAAKDEQLRKANEAQRAANKRRG